MTASGSASPCREMPRPSSTDRPSRNRGHGTIVESPRISPNGKAGTISVSEYPSGLRRDPYCDAPQMVRRFECPGRRSQAVVQRLSNWERRAPPNLPTICAKSSRRSMARALSRQMGPCGRLARDGGGRPPPVNHARPSRPMACSWRGRRAGFRHFGATARVPRRFVDDCVPPRRFPE